MGLDSQIGNVGWAEESADSENNLEERLNSLKGILKIKNEEETKKWIREKILSNKEIIEGYIKSIKKEVRTEMKRYKRSFLEEDDKAIFDVFQNVILDQYGITVDKYYLKKNISSKDFCDFFNTTSAKEGIIEEIIIDKIILNEESLDTITKNITATRKGVVDTLLKFEELDKAKEKGEIKEETKKNLSELEKKVMAMELKMQEETLNILKKGDPKVYNQLVESYKNSDVVKRVKNKFQQLEIKGKEQIKKLDDKKEELSKAETEKEKNKLQKEIKIIEKENEKICSDILFYFIKYKETTVGKADNSITKEDIIEFELKQQKALDRFNNSELESASLDQYDILESSKDFKELDELEGIKLVRKKRKLKNETLILASQYNLENKKELKNEIKIKEIFDKMVKNKALLIKIEELIYEKIEDEELEEIEIKLKKEKIEVKIKSKEKSEKNRKDNFPDYVSDLIDIRKNKLLEEDFGLEKGSIEQEKRIMALVRFINNPDQIPSSDAVQCIKNFRYTYYGNKDNPDKKKLKRIKKKYEDQKTRKDDKKEKGRYDLSKPQELALVDGGDVLLLALDELVDQGNELLKENYDQDFLKTINPEKEPSIVNISDRERWTNMEIENIGKKQITWETLGLAAVGVWGVLLTLANATPTIIRALKGQGLDIANPAFILGPLVFMGAKGGLEKSIGGILEKGGPLKYFNLLQHDFKDPEIRAFFADKRETDLMTKMNFDKKTMRKEFREMKKEQRREQRKLENSKELKDKDKIKKIGLYPKEFQKSGRMHQFINVTTESEKNNLANSIQTNQDQEKAVTRMKVYELMLKKGFGPTDIPNIIYLAEKKKEVSS